MRCKNIPVHFKIPVPVNEPDLNGNIYQENAIVSACEKATGKPIIQRDEDGGEIVVGIAQEVWYEDGYICVNGVYHYGGTCERVKFNHLQHISDMKITSFSLCQ